jgi:drug/metabolite transporter (DMT)-like permease
MSDKQNVIYIKLLLMSLLWGGTFLATRVASQFVTPFQGAFLRFLIAATGLVIVFLFSKQRFPKWNLNSFLLTILMSFSGIIAYNYFFFNALSLLPASRASLLVSINPIIILLLSVLFYGEKLTPIKVLGVLLSLFGAVVVISRGNISHLFDSFGRGEIFAIGCPVSWAIYSILNKQLMNTQTPLFTTMMSSILGVICLLPLAQNDGLYFSNLPQNAWLCLAYLGLAGTVLGFVWYAEGIETVGIVKTSIFNNLVPVFGVLLSVVILKEEVSFSVLFGGLLVLLGIALVNFGHLIISKNQTN